MTMDAMVRYLESRGFKADKKYDPSTKSYRFTIEREGNYLVKYFRWFNCDKPWLYQEAFLKEMIRDFDDRFEVESLYPKIMLDYIKHDVNTTSCISDIINKLIHEKEKEKMNCVQWKVKHVDIDRRVDEIPCITANIEADISGLSVIDCAELTASLRERLSATMAYNGYLYPKKKPIVPSAKLPEIKNVIFNDPATIVIWKDGTKTVVKAQNNELFDPEKGLAMAITKKALGNEGNYFNTIKECLDTYYYPTTGEQDNKWLAIQRLYNALGDKKATKADLKFAMEEAIKYLEGEK